MHFEKNLAALAKRWPQYAAVMANTPLTGRFQIQPSARAGVPNLIDLQLNVLYYNNTDPVKNAENDIINKKIKLAQIALIMGLGLAYHLSAFIQLFSKVRIEKIFLCEKEWEVLRTLMKSADLRQLFAHPALELCMGPEPAQFYPRFHNALNEGSAKFYMNSINIIETAAVRGNAPYYAECVKILKQAVGSVLTLYGNDPKDSLIGISNTFHNINSILELPGIKDMKDAFKNKPGIVVSTGPSLNKNIELLREVADRAVIGGADASLKVLLKHGLKPDFVTSLERVIETAALFEGVTEEDAEGVYFAACPVVMPETLAAFKGEEIMVYRPFATFQWLGMDKGYVDTGPSAGNMAFNVLKYMGCNPIILIGQDLAFAGEKTHAEGTHYGDQQDSGAWAKDVFIVEGNDEPTVRTTRIWEMFRQTYERDIAAFNGRVINATEGGAKIRGTELMTLREAIDTFLKKPLGVKNMFKKRLRIPMPAQIQRDRKEVVKKVEGGIDYCQYMIDSMKNAAEQANQAITSHYEAFKQGDEEVGKNLADAYREFERSYALFQDERFYLILMHYVQSYFIKSMLELNGIRANEEENPDTYAKLLAKGVVFYIDMMNLIEVMKAEMDSMLELLKQKEL